MFTNYVKIIVSLFDLKELVTVVHFLTTSRFVPNVYESIFMSAMQRLFIKQQPQYQRELGLEYYACINSLCTT